METKWLRVELMVRLIAAGRSRVTEGGGGGREAARTAHAGGAVGEVGV